jgi:hypothetical protein
VALELDGQGPDILLAFVGHGLDTGPILSATGEFQRELERHGAQDIGDHNMPMPNAMGLLLFEGWIEIGPGDDPEVNWTGEWRRLTHWEMVRVRCGKSPWAEPTERAEPQGLLTPKG